LYNLGEPNTFLALKAPGRGDAVFDLVSERVARLTRVPKLLDGAARHASKVVMDAEVIQIPPCINIIPLVFLYTRYTGWRQNDLTVHTYAKAKAEPEQHQTATMYAENIGLTPQIDQAYLFLVSAAFSME
jgi:hypothetical protein